VSVSHDHFLYLLFLFCHNRSKLYSNNVFRLKFLSPGVFYKTLYSGNLQDCKLVHVSLPDALTYNT